MIRRQFLEHLGARDHEPADGAAPDLAGKAGDGVGPGPHAVLVPAVPAQRGDGRGRGVHHPAQVGVAGLQLPRALLQRPGVAEGRAVVAEEDRAHERAVQPQLVRVDQLVLEAALCVHRFDTRIGVVQPVADCGGGGVVPLVAGGGVEAAEQHAGHAVVEAVEGHAGERAVGGHELVDPGLDEVVVGGVAVRS